MWNTELLQFTTLPTLCLNLFDKLQDSFLQKLGIAPLEALMEFNLAPLATRRDIAMLGLVHRAVLRKGPPQFWEFFTKAPDTAKVRIQFSHRRHLSLIHI